jgi:hypothetical protein
MKKLTTLLFISILSITVYAEDTIKIKSSETEQIIDKYGNKIVESFNAFANKTLPIAEEGFKIVVKLQIAKGIGNFIPLIIFIVFLILLNKEYNKIIEITQGENCPRTMSKNHSPFSEYNASLFLILYVTGVIIFFIISSISIYRATLLLISPEWYAIKEIMNLF